MKTKTKMQRWIPSLITAVALAGSASLCQAQSVITLSNDTSQSPAFYDGFSPVGTEVYTWQATGGPNGGGCIQVVFDGSTTKEIDPAFNVSFTSGQYLQVTFQMKVDSSSGTTTSPFGSYGNLQMALRDSSYSWTSVGYAAIYPPAANGWVTHTYTIPSPSFSVAHLQFQLQAGAAYSGPVTVYIGNVTIVPVPNPWVIDAFTNDTSSTYIWENWSVSSTAALNTSQEAGGGTPNGALQCDFAFPVAAQWAAWGQSWLGHEPSGFAMDPSRFVYWECDVKVDAANSTPFSGGDYGYLTFNIRNGSWGDNSCSPDGVTLDSSYTSWKHVKLALPVISSSVGFDVGLKGNYMGPVRLYIDNIKMSKPTTLPKIQGLAAAGPSGTKITLSGPGNQWDRQSICVPSGTATTVNYTWGGQTPATYSLTITNFPAPANAPGLEGHIFITTGDSGYDETISSPDWNAPNLAVLRVENGTNGGVVASFEWKTNLPSANPDHTYSVNLPAFTSANGTWTLNFSDDTHGSIVGPNGLVVTNITLDADMMTYFTAPSASFVQVGAFKNDSLNAGTSDNKGFILTQVLMTNVNATIFNDDFSAGLTNNYAWRVTSAAAITSIPQGTAYWLKWGVPDNGFTPQSAASVLGGWSDAGITYIYTDTTGTNRFGAVPTVSLPAGNNAFFRLINTNAP